MVWEFLLNFFKVFVDGIISIFYTKSNSNNKGGVFGGIIEIFNFNEYFKLFIDFKCSNPSLIEWIFCIIGIIMVFAVLIGLVLVLVLFIRKMFYRIFSKETNQDLIDEIARLRSQLKRSEKNRDRLLKFRTKGKGKLLEADGYDDEGNNIQNSNVNSRFHKLIKIDEKYQNYEHIESDFDYSLFNICNDFRLFAAKELNLYYDLKTIRIFFASFAASRIIVLQGISGTGKTSLPYAVGKWLGNEATIVPVQPFWRDRSEIFGYFNEFTRKYNETELLKQMYEARYRNDLFLTIIDEANIARVEYYFAELLSILEMPSKDEWVVDITSSSWDSDPKFIEDGRFRLPENMWYILTINNDDSTFALSEKVYDRAMPISINKKALMFDVGDIEYQKNVKISYQYLEKLFIEAKSKYKVKEENLRLLNLLSDYLMKHFNLSFGNRIIKQIKEFVPVYIACGGDEMDALDYFLTNKILRKLESFNLAYIRSELEGLITYLNKHFGKTHLKESKEYLNKLKK